MKKLFIIITLFFIGCFSAYAQSNLFKDIRVTYLWDVTLSMKGYNGMPNIYNKVVEVILHDIEKIDNERTEIVVIPFQDSEYCEVWREYATPQGKSLLKNKIKNYDNQNRTNTNISAPIQYAINNIFSVDKIDIMKLMTDGFDNVDPHKFKYLLENWCNVAKSKDVYGYYILLTDIASEKNDIVYQVEELCQFEIFDVSGDISMINTIRQVNISQIGGVAMSINVRDEYNAPKAIKFKSYSGNVEPGYMVHFKTLNNPYIEIDEVAEMGSDMSFELHPQFKTSKSNIMAEQWTEYSGIVLEMTPVSTEGEHRYTRLLDRLTKIQLINKPEKTVSFYVL